MTSFRQRMLEDMQVRRLSPFTQRTYVETVPRGSPATSTRSPERLGPGQIRAYRVSLATERRLTTGSLLVAVAALRFLYRVTLQKRWSFDDVISAPKKPQSLPVVLSPQEVGQFLRDSRAARSSLPAGSPAGSRVSPSPFRHIHVALPSRSISSRPAPTCAPFSSCSGIGVCRPPRATCGSRPPRSARPPVRWTCSRGRVPQRTQPVD